MSIQSQITRINNNIKNAYDAVAAKEGEIPSNKNSENLAGAIESIQTEELNVYAQIDEPDKKEGVWIRTEIIDTDILYERLNDMPYKFSTSQAVIIGNYMYLLGNTYSPYKTAYKYNMSTGEYTKLTDIPYGFAAGCCIADNNDIYLFGSSITDSDNEYIYSQYTYKYNTLTDTYTRLIDIPYQFYQGGVFIHNHDIYLFGGSVSNTGRYFYRYDIANNEYTQLISLPFFSSLNKNAIIKKFDDVYIFGAGYNPCNYLYKYNITLNNFTRLANIPYKFFRGDAYLYNDDIYLFGSGVSEEIDYTQKSYKYNITTNTYKKLVDMPWRYYNGTGFIKDENIYLFGGGTTGVLSYMYTISDIDKVESIQVQINDKKADNDILNNNYIYIINELSLYEVMLSKILKLYINTAYYYNDNEIKKYPCYYGNGESWNLIENK